MDKSLLNAVNVKNGEKKAHRKKAIRKYYFVLNQIITTLSQLFVDQKEKIGIDDIR